MVCSLSKYPKLGQPRGRTHHHSAHPQRQKCPAVHELNRRKGGRKKQYRWAVFRGCLKQTQLQSKMEKQLPVRSIQVETCGVVHLLKGNFLKCNNSKFRLKTSELVKADNVVTFVHNVETFFLINERAQVHIS